MLESIFLSFFLKSLPNLMIFGSFSENVNFAKISVSPRRKPLSAGPEPRKFTAKLVEKWHRKKTEKMLQFTSNFTTCWLLLKAPGHFFGVKIPFFVNEGPHIVFKRASGTFFDRFGDPHHPQEGSWYHLRLIFGGFGRLAFLDFVAMANVS